MRGLRVDELPFQVHSDIPVLGISAGPRTGPMYTTLEREAKEAGLAQHWPRHLPNTRKALAAAKWARQHDHDEAKENDNKPISSVSFSGTLHMADCMSKSVSVRKRVEWKLVPKLAVSA